MKVIIRDPNLGDKVWDIIRAIKPSVVESEVEVVHSNSSGKFIHIIDGSDSQYVIYSSLEGPEGRNSYIAQRISPAVSVIWENNINEKISVYLFYNTKQKEQVVNDYQMGTYRLLQTLGINILNAPVEVKPYLDVDDWITKRKLNESEQNDSSVFDDKIIDKYTFYGKTFGANGREAVLICLALKKITNKEFEYVPIVDNGEKKLTVKEQSLLKKFGINYIDEPKTFEEKIKNLATARKQESFKRNLSTKYGVKKCYLCECEIPGLIVASHIHRVADIDSDFISLEEKQAQTTAADNGLWLCSLHDKMFELGLINFDNNGELRIRPTLDKGSIQYVSNSIKVKKISNDHLTESMKKYLEKHRKRTGSLVKI